MFFIFLCYISANQKVQGGKKKNPTHWVLFPEIEKVLHYPTLERGRVEYVW